MAAARRKRTGLYLSVVGLVAMAAAVSSVSAGDPDGVGLRAGMVIVMIASAVWLRWQALLPAALLIWFGPNYARSLAEDQPLFGPYMLLELPGMLGLALFLGLVRESLRRLEEEDRLLGATSEEYSGVDPDTGVYEERLLRPAIESELARSRRFDRQLALVLVGIDEMRQRFDYRDDVDWAKSFAATASLLRSTRTHIDRAYRYGPGGFALLLPECGERDVVGLVRRLRWAARRSEPSEGEPGGPLPTHFGATFFPDCATTAEDMIRRAEVALRLAEKNGSRLQLDGAEAPSLPAPETLRRSTQQEAATPVDREGVATRGANRIAAAAKVAEEVSSREAEAAPAAPIPLFPHVSIEQPEMEGSSEDEAAERLLAKHEPFTLVPSGAAAELDLGAGRGDEALAEDGSVALAMPCASVDQVGVTADVPSPRQDSVGELIKHMDETLAMIRALRSASS